MMHIDFAGEFWRLKLSAVETNVSRREEVNSEAEESMAAFSLSCWSRNWRRVALTASEQLSVLKLSDELDS